MPAAAAILAANAADVEAAQARDMAPALIDRLRLDPGRLAAIAQSVREVAALPDPVGEIEWQTTRGRTASRSAACASRWA